MAAAPTPTLSSYPTTYTNTVAPTTAAAAITAPAAPAVSIKQDPGDISSTPSSIMGRDARVVYRLIQVIWLHVNRHNADTINIDWNMISQQFTCDPPMSASECQRIWKYVAYQFPTTAFTKVPLAPLSATAKASVGVRARPSTQQANAAMASSSSSSSSSSSNSSPPTAASSSSSATPVTLLATPAPPSTFAVMDDDDSDIDGEPEPEHPASRHPTYLPPRRAIATIIEDSGLGLDERTGLLVETQATRFMAERGWASGVPGAAHGVMHSSLAPTKGVSPFAWRPQEDTYFLDVIREHGTGNWDIVASFMHHRHPNSPYTGVHFPFRESTNYERRWAYLSAAIEQGRYDHAPVVAAYRKLVREQSVPQSSSEETATAAAAAAAAAALALQQQQQAAAAAAAAEAHRQQQAIAAQQAAAATAAAAIAAATAATARLQQQALAASGIPLPSSLPSSTTATTMVPQQPK